jgi:hypothetical protein
MAAWDIGKNAELRLKYSITALNRGSYTYSGSDELRMQLRIRM